MPWSGWQDADALLAIHADPEKVYNLDLRRKEYAVMTFAELRAQMERARAEAQKSMEGMKPEERPEPQPTSIELEFDVKVDDHWIMRGDGS